MPRWAPVSVAPWTSGGKSTPPPGLLAEGQAGVRGLAKFCYQTMRLGGNGCEPGNSSY